MLHFSSSDTICALSTPPGSGAIGIIRLSGPSSFSICSEVFKARERTFDFETSKSHTIHLGVIEDGESILDEVLISIFKNPHSYTGEDVVEISTHGSTYIQQRLLQLLCSRGCRMANPGEFTLRAFMNGKFDLSQAEAVADLIAAQSTLSHDLAMRQMRGGFSKKIKELRARLIDFSSLIELELDFSEEDVEFANRPELLKLLHELTHELELLIKSFSIGNVIKRGLPVAIIGKPNAGKSTLLNAILNEEKAIVSDIPGTTRDAIEDTIVIDGFSFRFIDTAGLRDSNDTIESIGIERTWEKIHQASIILYVFDVTKYSFDDVIDFILELKEQTELQSRKLILIGNMTDLLEELPHGFSQFVEHETIFVSAKRKENIHLIAESLVRSIQQDGITDTTIITNARHHEALSHARQAILDVEKGFHEALPSDLLAVDIRKALYHLGEITGEITNDEILGNIFGRFCIGK